MPAGRAVFLVVFRLHSGAAGVHFCDPGAALPQGGVLGRHLLEDPKDFALGMGRVGGALGLGRIHNQGAS